MKKLFILFVGVVIGAGAVWYLTTKDSQPKGPGDHFEGAAKSARDTIEEKMRALDLKPDQIKDDLDRTGKVIRRKAHEAGEAFSDATADARITGAIKGKLFANKDLS